ncbi:MAG: deoxyguanosinetriphosphate triphosphohydrolase, partial [Caldilinea sp.]
LECQLSNLADEIAYNTSDLDDGLRSGILDPAQVKTLAIAQRTLDSLGFDADADLRNDIVRYRFIRRLVGIEVSDVVSATSRKLEEFGITSLADLRAASENVACYSPVLGEENRELKQFLFQHFYRHYRVVRMAVKAGRTLARLFEAYISEPRQLPIEAQQRVEASQEGLHRVVCDYLAGMTDRYAIQEYRRLYDMEERA